MKSKMSMPASHLNAQRSLDVLSSSLEAPTASVALSPVACIATRRQPLAAP